MSKYQLGWDQILGAPSAEFSADSPVAPKARPESAPDLNLEMKLSAEGSGPKRRKSEKNSETKRSRKSPASKVSAPGEETVRLDADSHDTASRADAEKRRAAEIEPSGEYSQKNWGRLEFKSSASKVQENKVNASSDAQERTAQGTVENSVDLQADADLSWSAPEPATEPEILTVSELNRNIRDILEGRFPLLWLKGEISNFKAHTSGHFYFSLKDAKAQISAVMFRGFNSQLKFRPEDGMEVVVRGKITVYEPRGNYQIFCELMEPVGAGALQKAFEQLKAKLQKEGLFDAARKRPLPALPRHIVIVTSPTGAAIRDMLNVLGRRFRGAQITVIPCKVQGDQAPREICQAIALANRLTDVDVMIVGRGGGSIEDLWAFNDEAVARAIAGARVPVISAVGHEVDFTIADFVADLRAPTPSAAAELVVKNASDLKERVQAFTRSLRVSILRTLNANQQSVVALTKRLVDPQRRIQDASLRCDELMQRIQNSMFRGLDQRRLMMEPIKLRLKSDMRNLLAKKRERLEIKMAVMDSLSPLRVLDRGYSMVTLKGRVVSHATDVQPNDEIRVRFASGAVEARVTKVDEN